MVCLSAQPRLMTAWVRRRRAALMNSLMAHPTSSQGWKSLCSMRWGWVWGGLFTSHVATLTSIFSKKVIWIYDATLILWYALWTVFLCVYVFKMFGYSPAQQTTTAVSTSLNIILHVQHGLGLRVIVFLSYLCVCHSVDKLRPHSVCRGSLGPCDYGGAGTGLQGWRCYPCPGCLT